jgi:hypothetical protein
MQVQGLPPQWGAWPGCLGMEHLPHYEVEQAKWQAIAHYYALLPKYVVSLLPRNTGQFSFMLPTGIQFQAYYVYETSLSCIEAPLVPLRSSRL